MIERLKAYDKKHRTSRSKGHLCVVLVLTRKSRTLGFPILPDSLLTKAGGQVLGLGKAAVQAILKDHGIVEMVLAEEGGRTSRGSIENMRNYVELLNELHNEGILDFDLAEQFWVGRVRAYFAGKPFKLKLDPSKSLRAVVGDLLGQALKRQREVTGTMYAGAMMQHLVGAKLTLLLPNEGIEHYGFSVADGPSERHGDFIIKKVAVHVTTAPSEALIRKCVQNVQDEYRPIIVTVADRVNVAESLAQDAGIGSRVDIFEIEQFLATNIYERSDFSLDKKRVTVNELVNKYNEVIDFCETDPSLKIALRK